MFTPMPADLIPAGWRLHEMAGGDGSADADVLAA